MRTIITVFLALVLFASLRNCGCGCNPWDYRMYNPRIYRIVPVVTPVHHIHSVVNFSR